MVLPVTHLVVHHNGVDGRTWRDILRSHLGNGWAGIGYHRVIHEDGSVHPGRASHKIGAHTSGFNVTRSPKGRGRSLAVVLIGNLDKHPMTPAQSDALTVQLTEWCRTHELDPFTSILGHHETRPFIRKPFLPTKKGCPGKFVDMHAVRAQVALWLKVTRA